MPGRELSSQRRGLWMPELVLYGTRLLAPATHWKYFNFHFQFQFLAQWEPTIVGLESRPRRLWWTVTFLNDFWRIWSCSWWRVSNSCTILRNFIPITSRKSVVKLIVLYEKVFRKVCIYRVSPKKNGLAFKGHCKPLNGRKSKKARKQTTPKIQFYLLGGVFTHV